METNSVRAQAYIDEQAIHGRYHVPTDDVIAAVRGNVPAVRAQLRRLKQRGVIAEPVRGFLVIVPYEYRQLGCLPAEQFVPQLMARRNEPYYFGLLTAAQHYGAAHQRPQTTQVIVRKHREAIECGKVRVEFIARGDLENMPVVDSNTPRGVARFSTPEVTALELVGYPKHAGGLSNAATVLSELAEEIDGAKLIEAAKRSPISWSQRLGYLWELLEQFALAEPLKPFVIEHARSYTPLRRAAGTAGHRVAPWKVIVNVEVEPDL
ncbi:MAG: type IV toxin-antitoxin system AbiEi family antitoxin [Proteobacteria bacterium]|nr:type IV toxin-antitoxin system AbiEi family antitoxin [Pseudomonadota bacterium]